MANMTDYVAWRGDITLEQYSWCCIDALLMATLSYLNFHGMDNPKGWTLEEAERIDLLQPSPYTSFLPRKEAFEAMARSSRFREARIHHFIALTDADREMQFSAMCVDLPDGTVCVAFRGTDNTLVGWREDFNMAYQPVVPGQEAARLYLERVAALSDQKLRLTGHSKGGNLAVYSAAMVDPAIQDRIESIWNFDGPGMHPDVFAGEGYAAIRGKIHSYVPQTAIIGLLMEYARPYTVVRSTASGASQHDPMSWQVYGPKFEEVEKIDQTASVVSDTLHEMLENSTPQQRGAFVDTLFRLAETTKATSMSELLNEKLKTLLTMVGNRRDVDPETRRVFTRLMAQTVALGVGNMIDRVRGRKETEAEEGAKKPGKPEKAPEKEPEKITETPAGKSTEKDPDEGTDPA